VQRTLSFFYFLLGDMVIFFKDITFLKYKPHLIKIKSTCFLYESHKKKPTTTPNQTPPTSLLKAVLVGRTIRMCLFF
jgi:intracellular septation protein A